MKYTLAISIIITLGLTSFAQDSTKRFEFGNTLFTLSPGHNPYMHYANGSASTYYKLEFANGLLFRYSQRKFSYRFNVVYTENYTGSNWSCFHCNNIFAFSKTFIGGFGVQYTPRPEWFYFFSDLNYTHMRTRGANLGGEFPVNETFLDKVNGLNINLGLGFKIKLSKKIYCFSSLVQNYALSAQDFQ